MAETDGKLLAHMVYFSLTDNSRAEIDKLLAACRKYLSRHPGTRLFAVGTAADYSRPVNDRDFDVALQLVFENRAAHDQYQVAPLHTQFIEEHKHNWAQVRIFDADVSS